MATSARKMLLVLLICLGVATDVSFAVTCHKAQQRYQKVCRERCCDEDEITGSEICCSYRSNLAIYLGSIISAVVILAGILACLYRIFYRRSSVRRSSVTSYGSADERFHSTQDDVSLFLRQPNLTYQTHITPDGVTTQIEIQMPPAYATLPPPYTPSDPAASSNENEHTYTEDPPPAYSTIYQSQTGDSTT